MNELVSIVIPTLNNSRTIGRCLESIRSQSHPSIECIIVDGDSTDGTLDIARRYETRIIQERGERTRAKNIGIETAKGVYICFIDSDMELAPGVISECIATLEPGEGGVVIPERSSGSSFWVAVRDFERSFYAGSIIESARFFPKELVEKAGGFDEDKIFFEESTLPERIAELGFGRWGRTASGIVHNEEGFGLLPWLKKKFHYGKSAWGSRHLSMTYRLGLFLRSRRFYLKPHLALGVMLLKSLEFAATVLGMVAEER